MTAHYTLIVGTKDWSSWSLRPYLALRATGAAFDEVLVPLRQQPLTGDEIKRYSKAGRVPILKIAEDGREVTVWDSLAICETLAERHSEARLWPADPLVRAEARAYAAEMHSGFADVRDQLSMDFARRRPLPALRPETEAQIARIIDAWSSALARFSDVGSLSPSGDVGRLSPSGDVGRLSPSGDVGRLSPSGDGGGFLFGGFSIADCMYAPVVSRFTTYGVSVPPPVKAYMERMMALPAMRDWGAAAQKEVDAGIV